MRLLPSLGLLLGLTTSAAADSPAAGPVIDRYLAAAKQMVGELKGVKDKATATAARPKIVQHHDAMVQSQKELQKIDVSDAEKKVLDERIRTGMAPFDVEFRRLSLMPEAFAVLADIDLFKVEAELYELHARMTAVKIDLTVFSYRAQHGKYPADLKAAFQPIKRDPPKDPWGRDYQYDPLGPRSRAADARQDRPDVWVVSPYGDGKKLLGNWDDKK